MRFEDENTLFNWNDDGESGSGFGSWMPDPEFAMPLFGEFNERPVVRSGELAGDPLGEPLGDPFGDPVGEPPGIFHAPEVQFDHLDLGIPALAGVEDPGPVNAGLKTEKAGYGTGIEAQKLRAVNVRSPEVVAYKRAVENLVGRLHVPKLRDIADLVRDRYHVSVGRDGRRGRWSLWAYFKKLFPDPADFVAFIREFVK